MLQADIFAAKAERYLRDGHQEAAARECVRGLGEVKDDDRLQQMFHKAVRRVLQGRAFRLTRPRVSVLPTG